MQLPLAVSGWGFKEEFSKVKIEKIEEEIEPMETSPEGMFSTVLKTSTLCSHTRYLLGHRSCTLFFSETGARGENQEN